MFEHLEIFRVHMNIYLRHVASEGINHHVEHCIFVPASRVLFSSRCPTFRVSLLSSRFDIVFRSSPRTGLISMQVLIASLFIMSWGFPAKPIVLTQTRRLTTPRRGNAVI